MQYLIGQRVIIDGDQIAIVIPHPKNARPIERESSIWVECWDGVKQFRALHNVKPLPGDQL